MREIFRTIWRWLNTPVFGTKAIPRDPHLDLSQLPEHAFPVYCNKCDYCLRGIPDGRCPECGKEFTREKLLVEQYIEILGGWSRRRSPLSRSLNWAFWLLVLGFPITLLGFGLWVKYQARDPARADLDAIGSVGFGLIIFWVLIVALPFCVCGWFVFHALRRRRKRMRVIGAIRDEDADKTQINRID